MEYVIGCFYVVYYHGAITVAKYHETYWAIIGYDGPIDTEDFDSIEYRLDPLINYRGKKE